MVKVLFSFKGKMIRLVSVYKNDEKKRENIYAQNIVIGLLSLR